MSRLILPLVLNMTFMTASDDIKIEKPFRDMSVSQAHLYWLYWNNKKKITSAIAEAYPSNTSADNKEKAREIIAAIYDGATYYYSVEEGLRVMGPTYYAAVFSSVAAGLALFSFLAHPSEGAMYAVGTVLCIIAAVPFFVRKPLIDRDSDRPYLEKLFSVPSADHRNKAICDSAQRAIDKYIQNCRIKAYQRTPDI